MNILLITTSSGFSGKSGGAAIACRRFMEALMLQGHQVKMLTMLDCRIKNVEAFYTVKGVSYFKHRMLRYWRYSRYYKGIDHHHMHSGPLNAADIRKSKLVEWADVINLHWVSGFIDYPSFFDGSIDKPIFWTLHDMNPFTGGCHYAESCRMFKADCQNCPQLPDNIKSLSRRNLAIKKSSNYDGLSIISPSHWLSNLSEESAIFKGLNHKVIPNCLDTDVFKYQEQNQSSDDIKKILFIANSLDVKLKGLHILLKSLELLTTNAQLIIIGDPKGIKLNQKHEYVDSEEKMAELLNSVDLFVTPSLEDNFPNVIVESLCCGTPVVGFQTGGIPELITNGVNGYLVKKNDIDDLTHQIDRALSTAWDRVKISQVAHRRFNYQRIGELYISEFESRLLKK